MIFAALGMAGGGLAVSWTAYRQIFTGLTALSLAAGFYYGFVKPLGGVNRNQVILLSSGALTVVIFYLTWHPLTEEPAVPMGPGRPVNPCGGRLEVPPIRVDGVREFSAERTVQKRLLGGENLEVRAFFMEPGQRLPAHPHRADHVAFLMEGQVSANVDGKVFALNPGQVLLGPKGSIVEVENTGKNRATFVVVAPKGEPGGH